MGNYQYCCSNDLLQVNVGCVFLYFYFIIIEFLLLYSERTFLAYVTIILVSL